MHECQLFGVACHTAAQLIVLPSLDFGGVTTVVVVVVIVVVVIIIIIIGLRIGGIVGSNPFAGFELVAICSLLTSVADADGCV